MFRVTSPEGSLVASRSTGPMALTIASGMVLPSSAVTITVSVRRAVLGGADWRPRLGAGAAVIGLAAGGV